MERLPKKYFGSISDYVKTYYTAWGVTSFADKAYTAIKTVTKDFTRTDPVFVRVGEDGEPEIHYTMTQADGTSYFEDMDLGNSNFYLHNGAVLTKFGAIFRASSLGSLNIDLLTASASGSYPFVNLKNCKRITFGEGTAITANGNPLFANYLGAPYTSLEEIGFFDISSSSSLFYTFYGLAKLREIAAYDFSKATSIHNSTFSSCSSLTAFHAYGMKASFNLSSTALKHDAILEVFNNLGTVDKTAGITLTLGSTKLALMSDAEKAIATEKGWFLA